MSVADLKKNIHKLDTGYGLMSLTWRAEPIPQSQAFEAMHRVVELSRERGHKAFSTLVNSMVPILLICRMFTTSLRNTQI